MYHKFEHETSTTGTVTIMILTVTPAAAGSLGHAGVSAAVFTVQVYDLRAFPLYRYLTQAVVLRAQAFRSFGLPFLLRGWDHGRVLPVIIIVVVSFPFESGGWCWCYRCRCR